MPKLGLLSSPAPSLSNVSEDIMAVYAGRGWDVARFTRVVPAFRARDIFEKAIVVMTFDPLYVGNWLLAAKDYNEAGIPTFTYITIEGRPKRFLTKPWMREKVRYVANSKFTAKMLTEAGVKVEGVVYHGVDVEALSKYFDLRLERLKEKVDEAQVCVVASGHRRKGLELLKKTIEFVAERDQGVKFNVLTDKRGFTQLAGAPRTEILAMFGQLSRSEVYSFMAGCDIYLQPSLAEGFCLPILEAMAMGMPCVHADYMPLSEITCVDVNFIVEPQEVVEMDFGDGILYTCHYYEPELMARALLDAVDMLRGRREAFIDVAYKAREHAARFDIRKVYPELERYWG